MMSTPRLTSADAPVDPRDHVREPLVCGFPVLHALGVPGRVQLRPRPGQPGQWRPPVEPVRLAPRLPAALALPREGRRPLAPLVARRLTHGVALMMDCGRERPDTLPRPAARGAVWDRSEQLGLALVVQTG